MPLTSVKAISKIFVHVNIIFLYSNLPFMVGSRIILHMIIM